MTAQTVRFFVLKHELLDDNGASTSVGLQQIEATIKACFQQDQVPVHAIYTCELPGAHDAARLAALMTGFDEEAVCVSKLANPKTDTAVFAEFLEALTRYMCRTQRVTDQIVNIIVVTGSPNVEFGLPDPNQPVDHGDAVLYEFTYRLRTNEIGRLPTAQHLPCPLLDS